jgi:hypothetical protein
MSKLYKIAKPIPSGRKVWSIVESPIPGTLGGNAPGKLYGRLDCPTALRYLAMGKYVSSRVFFHTEDDAIACGFRPCFSCLREKYQDWKSNQ